MLDPSGPDALTARTRPRLELVFSSCTRTRPAAESISSARTLTSPRASGVFWLRYTTCGRMMRRLIPLSVRAPVMALRMLNQAGALSAFAS